jgi:hypothetical protein
VPTYFTIQENIDEPLETVLFKLYPATFLKWLWETSLKDLVDAHHDLLPQGDDSEPCGKSKTPKKGALAMLLLDILEDKTLCTPFFESLPEATQSALSLLVWQGAMPLADAEETIGTPLADLNPDKRRWHFDAFITRPEHGFVCVLKNSEYGWGYRRSRNEEPDRSAFTACLPPAVRRALKVAVPRPADYQLLPLDQMADACMEYSCASRAVSDIKLVAEYIQQGHLKYTKAEKVSKPCVRHIRSMTPGAEFFEHSDDRDLELLRTRLLIGAMAFAGEKARECLLTSVDAEPIRSLFEALLAAPAFFGEELQGHLGNSRRSWIDYDSQGPQALAAFFATLPRDKWVSFDNIQRYHTLRDRVPTLFGDAPIGFDVRVERSNDYWGNRTYVDADNVFALSAAPLLKGFAFFLAALGMAEVAYDLPTNAHYTRPNKTYLSPFDGLQGIRLTPLGEFVLGTRKTYDIESDAPHHTVVVLDRARLLASCPDIDPLTELALKQFMETLTPGHYRMTHKSLLGGCASRKELEARIALFRRVISDTPPQVWERFFESTLNRIDPLQPEPERVVLRIDSDDDLRRLFASDPVLRQHSLKVEGLRVAILKSDLKIITKRLTHFGYLCPLTSLRAKSAPEKSR